METNSRLTAQLNEVVLVSFVSDCAPFLKAFATFEQWLHQDYAQQSSLDP